MLDDNGINYIIYLCDFVFGKVWFDNMVDSVYNSRKVIVIMFSNYFLSVFCRDEMWMVIYRCLERDDFLLIVVWIDNIKFNDIFKSVCYRIFIDVISKEEMIMW